MFIIFASSALLQNFSSFFLLYSQLFLSVECRKCSTVHSIVSIYHIDIQRWYTVINNVIANENAYSPSPPSLITPSGSKSRREDIKSLGKEGKKRGRFWCQRDRIDATARRNFFSTLTTSWAHTYLDRFPDGKWDMMVHLRKSMSSSTRVAVSARTGQRRRDFRYYTRDLRNRYAGKLYRGLSGVRSSTTTLKTTDLPEGSSPRDLNSGLTAVALPSWQRTSISINKDTNKI